MHIYIDESGTFAMPRRVGPAVSCVGAVIIPDATHDIILADFAALSAAWPKTANGELKGRLLSENHFYEAVKFFTGRGVLFDCVALDAGLHRADEVIDHRNRQAKNLERAVTPAHQPTMIAEVMAIAREIRGLSAQQYLQSVAMNQLVAAVLATKVMYFAQTSPSELGRFRWRVDAKSQTITPAELLWHKLVPMILEAQSIRRPDIHLVGADYSHYERFMRDISLDDLRRRYNARVAPLTIQEDVDTERGTDIGMVLREDFEFRDSQAELGLQVADILTSVAGRALRGNIGKRGWWWLGGMMIKPLPPSEVIRVIQLHRQRRRWITDPAYGEVFPQLDRMARSMLVGDSDD